MRHLSNSFHNDVNKIVFNVQKIVTTLTTTGFVMAIVLDLYESLLLTFSITMMIFGFVILPAVMAWISRRERKNS